MMARGRSPLLPGMPDVLVLDSVRQDGVVRGWRNGGQGWVALECGMGEFVAGLSGRDGLPCVLVLAFDLEERLLCGDGPLAFGGGRGPGVLVLHAGSGFCSALEGLGLGGLPRDSAVWRDLVHAYLRCQDWQHGGMWEPLARWQLECGLRDGFAGSGVWCLSELGWKVQECGQPLGLLARGAMQGGLADEREALDGVWRWWARAADAGQPQWERPCGLLEMFLGMEVLAVDSLAGDAGDLRRWAPRLSDDANEHLADAGRLAVGLDAQGLAKLAGAKENVLAPGLRRIVVELAQQGAGRGEWVPGSVWRRACCVPGGQTGAGGWKVLRAFVFKGVPCPAGERLAHTVNPFGALQSANDAAGLWSLCWLRSCLAARWPLAGCVLPP